MIANTEKQIFLRCPVGNFPHKTELYTVKSQGFLPENPMLFSPLVLFFIQQWTMEALLLGQTVRPIVPRSSPF